MAVRSFIALALSDEVRTVLTELLVELSRTGAPVKWVEPENLHLTLKFLGEVPEGQITEIVAALGAVARATPAFTFTVRGVGGFPDLRRPRVLWVGVDAPRELLQLHRMVEAAMERLGFPPEKRAFHPHITLGRVKTFNGLAAVLTVLQRYAGAMFGVTVARQLTLFRSDLSREGPTYTPLAHLPFGG
ncbi:RNA 2',3'-cyclic phosphodiesterase [bacterium HR17]|uniref:RNA 2',3'-cyclic phosphodiesterase n=1 Tax=Candidatus Fervidibacter japonicus TaxID=2035412 RepID=A0A2H5XB27_9BACT|nr:RNA 2',3'-cyclic phosphodiesterase [bacterium HR17]